MTKEIFCKIDPQLSEFEKQDSELERLEKLVLSSDIYRSKAQLYTRARVQVQQLVQQTEDLKQEYSRFIREMLIGAELSRFEPNSMPDVLERKLTLHSKYEAISSEFQDLKIEIEAHTDLSMQSSV